MDEETVNVLEFQKDGISSSWSWASLNSSVSLLTNGVNSLTALTLCFRVFFPFYRNVHTVVTITNDKYLDYVTISLGKDGVNLILADQVIWSSITALPGYWNTLCSEIDFVESMWILHINEKNTSLPLNVTSSDVMFPAPVSVIFGQSLNEDKSGYISSVSYRGKLTDFQIWNRGLNDEERERYLECEHLTGSLIKWEPKTLILNDTVSISSIPRENICRPQGTYRVFLSPPLLLPVAESICQILKGNLSVEGVVDVGQFVIPDLMALKQNEAVTRVKNSLRKLTSDNEYSFVSHAKDKWKRIQNVMKKGSYSKRTRKKMLSPKVKSNLLKYSGRSNTKNFTSETVSHLKTNEVEEDAMNVEENIETVNEELDYISYCDFQEAPVFRANGFCSDVMNIVEEKYILIGKRNEDELPLIQGFTGRKITFSNGMWVANSPFSSFMELWFEGPREDPTLSPMGRHEWLIMVTVNDDILEDEVKLPCDSEFLYLSLSPCPADGYFTCSDGTCLPHTVRCDRKPDCFDKSDEDFCYKVDVPEQNRFDLPARPLEGDNVTEVDIKLFIVGAKIEYDVMTIVTDIWLTWKDPDLLFYNLNFDPLANLVDVDALNEIWTPTLEFGDNEKKKIVKSNDSEIFVLKENFGSFETYEFSWEAMNYRGVDNSLQMKERVQIDAKCTFNTALFPFGPQVCSFPFVLTSALPDAVELSSSGAHAGVSWSRANDDLKYDISSIQLAPKTGSLYSTQELLIKIHPRCGLALITLYFPSLFIIALTISSLYLSLELFQLRIGSAMGCLIAHLILQIQAGSPITGKTGVNAGDIWLFGALLIIFGVNILHVRIIKDIHSVEEKRPNTMQVAPVSMMNGKVNNVQSKISRTDFEIALILSNKWRKIVSVSTVVLIIIYIIVLSILTAVYVV